MAGDTVDGSAVRIEPAIEVGNIFKLGTRYSDPLGATYLDESGKSQHIWMGSYGFGPARTAAAAVEQYADAEGISWPRTIAPFDVELVTLGKPGSEERTFSDTLYRDLQATGPRRALRRARRRARREVHRRRAAGLPAAAHRRAPDAGRRARSRSRCAAGASRAPSRWRARREAVAELWRGLP